MGVSNVPRRPTVPYTLSFKEDLDYPAKAHPAQCNYQSTKHIQDAYENRMSQRAWVLDDYLRRRDPELLDNPFVKTWSGNADIKSDITVARRLFNKHGETSFMDIVSEIYGVTDLEFGLSDTFQPAKSPLESSPTSQTTSTLSDGTLMSITSSSNTENPEPWGKLTEYGPRAQSLKEALQESRYQHLSNPFTNTPSSRPNLISNEDMLPILSARGTVLLNTSFHSSPSQKAILKLSCLALFLWRKYVTSMSSSPIPSVPINKLVETNEDIIAFHFMVPLILDDIHTHLLRAIATLSPALKRLQERHIRVFEGRVACWQSVFSGCMGKGSRKMYRPYHHEETAQYASVNVQDIKAKCERALVGYDEEAEALLASLKARAPGNREEGFNHGEGYTGSVQGFDGMVEYGRLEVPRLERNGEGVWLDC